MTNATTILLALTFALATGCANQENLRDVDGGYVPDEPAEIEEEEVIEDEEEEVIEDEEEVIEDEEEEEILEALQDNDTFDDPLFFYSFLGSGTQHSVTVSDDASAPFGDVHDWVGFHTPAPQNSLVNVTVTLDCDSDDLTARLFEDTNAGPIAFGGSYEVDCGETDTFLIPINSDYLMRVFFPYGTDEQTLVPWEMTISW